MFLCTSWPGVASDRYDDSLSLRCRFSSHISCLPVRTHEFIFSASRMLFAQFKSKTRSDRLDPREKCSSIAFPIKSVISAVLTGILYPLRGNHSFVAVPRPRHPP